MLTTHIINKTKINACFKDNLFKLKSFAKYKIHKNEIIEVINKTIEFIYIYIIFYFNLLDILEFCIDSNFIYTFFYFLKYFE